jgi:hypothetical protein
VLSCSTAPASARALERVINIAAYFAGVSEIDTYAHPHSQRHAVFESAFKALNELLLAFLGAMFERPGKLSDYIKSPYVVSL